MFRSNRKLTACATQPLRIAIDAHSVGARLGGNETYAINLIEALAEIDRTNLYCLCDKTGCDRSLRKPLAQLYRQADIAAHAAGPNSADPVA